MVNKTQYKDALQQRLYEMEQINASSSLQNQEKGLVSKIKGIFTSKDKSLENREVEQIEQDSKKYVLPMTSRLYEVEEKQSSPEIFMRALNALMQVCGNIESTYSGVACPEHLDRFGNPHWRHDNYKIEDILENEKGKRDNELPYSQRKLPKGFEWLKDNHQNNMPCLYRVTHEEDGREFHRFKVLREFGGYHGTSIWFSEESEDYGFYAPNGTFEKMNDSQLQELNIGSTYEIDKSGYDGWLE